MPRLKHQLSLVLVVTLFATCTGCAPRQSSGIYRLSEIDSQYFLLSPDSSATSQGDHQTLRIAHPPRNKNAGPATECSIKGFWFSFYPAPKNEPAWMAETPSASAWAKSAGAIDMMDQWQSFERALYGLQQKQCFASPDEFLSAKQRIAAGLSAPASETLFYRYAYRAGGYVDLAPGMQLLIERDFFTPHSSNPPRSTDYQGTTITYYYVAGNTGSRTALKFIRMERKPSGLTTPASSFPDAGLAAQFAAALRLRLFLQDLAVSDNVKSPAILIGTTTNEDLNDVTRAIASDAGISCTSQLLRRVTCAFFDGVVTVSPMLDVFVNGKSTYIPIGCRLWFVIPQITNQQRAGLVRTLRVERRFQGRLVGVKFSRSWDVISQLLLFGGDRVSWSKTIAVRSQKHDTRTTLGIHEIWIGTVPSMLGFPWSMILGMRISWRLGLRLVLVVVAVALVWVRIATLYHAKTAATKPMIDLGATMPLNQPGGSEAPAEAYEVYSALYQASMPEPLAFSEDSMTDIPQVNGSCLRPAAAQGAHDG